MAIPLGPWTVTYNCERGQLHLVLDDAHCNLVQGSTFNGRPIYGFWDESTQKLTFVTAPVPEPTTGQPDLQSLQIFTGYLMSRGDPPEHCGRIAGSFEAFAHAVPPTTAGTCKRSVFGWFAELG